MLKNKGHKKKEVATRWDAMAKTFLPCAALPVPPARTSVPPNLGLCLHGVYVFNPTTSTPESLRQFLWAGIRLLNKEVKALGLSDEEVKRIVTGTFDAAHDTAGVIWAALQRIRGEPRPQFQARATVEPPAPVEVVSEYPIADDIYEPVEHWWTPERARVLEALKDYTEATHADR